MLSIVHCFVYMCIIVGQVHNSDGVWLRLSPESVRQYCSGGSSGQQQQQEAWCLQYNQHLGKTLLVPLDHPKTILDQVCTSFLLASGMLMFLLMALYMCLLCILYMYR